MVKRTVDCIVPFYNEGERVVAVVAALVSVPFIARIICVDDGSKDYTRDILKTKFPKIILVRLEKNIGKAGAIFAGLKEVKHENVLLLDGDLINVNSQEVETACNKFLADPSLDMLIIKYHGERRYKLMDDVFRNYIVQSGDRILKTKDLREVERLHPIGYQIEVAINQYMMDHHKNVRWFPISALNLHKTHKLSFFEGWWKDLRMDREIMAYLGPVRRLQQILFFCRKKVT